MKYKTKTPSGTVLETASQRRYVLFNVARTTLSGAVETRDKGVIIRRSDNLATVAMLAKTGLDMIFDTSTGEVMSGPEARMRVGGKVIG